MSPGFLKKFDKLFANPVWVLIGAFGTYFCMYGFRKPYTAATYADQSFLHINYKVLLIISQTLGYVLAKWVGIKFVSEIKRERRVLAIIGLICFAEAMLLLFAVIPKPWNIICIFLNGLPLGVIFGLVLGFLEGRKTSEFLIAGLCSSFILSDGVSKSVGTLLLNWGTPESWMPFMAGLIFAIPMALFIGMLTLVPAPTAADVEHRTAREPMTGAERWKFFWEYFPGLLGITIVYLFVTLLRSVRADFAVEIWTGLGYKQTPDLFTRSEIYVSFGAILITSFAVLIKDHFKAFGFALLSGLTGLVLIFCAVRFLGHGMDAFPFMVLVGLGVYLPYVAIHAVVFERLIAVTREKANVGFLMYIVDSVGYTGYIGLMLLKYLTSSETAILPLFIRICIYMSAIGILLIIFTYLYFNIKLKHNDSRVSSFSAR
ncbi:DUF5690 family protein [Mucilaginibacter jinjuensis]|uniref:DUF5690 family protein n=1 Tax=Mucilaginibacter jinjuensis TaxID=1176721 RepID=A0ABY7TEE8_9SPHI|nr:DUF5690 family protein [Mucilaginibacter jinjuensis]WCT14836.1 DUF5690 family protein [Mucilaginibacter jinjuensis]